MSERNEDHSKHTPHDAFKNIIEASETRDAGIVLFEKSIREQELFLEKKYTGRNDTTFDEIDATQNELDEQWMFYGDIALVSGRIYLTDKSLEDKIPRSWGEKNIDPHSNRSYYFLENVALRSHGVEVIPIRNENMDVQSIRIGYVFSQDDMNGEKGGPVLVGYPGELARHVYETPTPAEVELRLKRKWPKEFNTIRHLVKPQLQAAMPRRVTKLSEIVHTQLAESEQFRTLLELYLDDQLSFDQILPYFVTATDQMFVYDSHDGESPHTKDSQHGSWLALTLANPLTFLAYRPSVKTFFDQYGLAQLNITAEIFNGMDGDEPEYVRFLPHRVHHFRSTRAQQSILDRVLSGVFPDQEQGMNRQTQFERVVSQLDLATIDGGVVPEELPESPHPQEIEAMILLEADLVEVQAIIQQAKKIVYPTRSEAHKASLELTRTVASQLIGAGLKNAYRFMFSGSGVELPHPTSDTAPVKDQPSFEFVYAMDQERGLKELENGDVIEGTVETVTGDTRPIFDETTHEVVGYVVHPVIVGAISSVTKTLYPWNSLSLTEVRLTNKAVIALDGSAELTILELQRYRRITQSLEKAAMLYGDDPIIKRFKKIQQVLETELPDSYTSLEQVDLLTGIHKSVERLQKEGKNTTGALELAESLLVNKLIMILGDVFTVNGESIALEDHSLSGGPLSVRVVDIVNNNPMLGVSMIVQHGTLGFLSIPIRSIKAFRF